MIDPYIKNLVGKTIFSNKSTVTADFIVIMDETVEERRLSLIPQLSRVVSQNEIHELIFTCEQVAPGSVVNKISYCGFALIKNGGVLLHGDEILINDNYIGILAGFDETHYPNHLNIVIQTEQLKSGKQMGLQLYDTISFIFKK